MRAHLFTLDSLCFYVVDLLQPADKKCLEIRFVISRLCHRMPNRTGKKDDRMNDDDDNDNEKDTLLNEANVVRSILCDFCLALGPCIVTFPRITFSCALLHPRNREESFARAM